MQAARWAKANPKVTGKAREEALLKQPWDASVKALTAVPTVLQMMSDKLDWTQQLGDAVLAQQEDVMAAVQVLRGKAKAAEQLKTTPQQKVTSHISGSQEVIVIEPVQPDMIYVPVYNPNIVYGTWAYPSYPPYDWYPPGWVASNVFSFAAGVVVGAAIWGNCDWRHNHVNIDINRYNSFNRATIQDNKWEHNSIHRKGVAYSNKEVAARFGRDVSVDTRKREEFRGRVEQGQLDLDQRGDPGWRQGGNAGASRSGQAGASG